jgi:hypothetical protein
LFSVWNVVTRDRTKDDLDRKLETGGSDEREKGAGVDPAGWRCVSSERDGHTCKYADRNHAQSKCGDSEESTLDVGDL